jgi:hypothetical protein
MRLVLTALVCLVVSACTASPARGPQATPGVSAPASPTAAASAPASSAPSHTPRGSDSTALDSDPLHAVKLVDVRTGAEFSLGELAAEKPLLLEPMAIWCTNCRAQMHNVTAAHQAADFHSVSLDVEPAELPEDLAAYADREGFNWPFAKADGALMGELRQRFGTAVAFPPSMPKILFGTDGSVELIGLDKLLSPEEIAAAVEG